MGGDSEVVVGYKYYIGVHMGLCLGPVDDLRGIYVDDKVAAEGILTAGDIEIDEENLFGGESREGGVSGTVEFLDGSEDQSQSSYLVSKLGGANGTPYFRGFASVVLQQVYVGLNPYLKNWAFRVRRIHKQSNGDDQWYDAKSSITILPDYSRDQIIFFALDYSYSMQYNDACDNLDHQDPERLDILIAAVEDALDFIAELRVKNNVQVDIGICKFNDGDSTRTEFWYDWGKTEKSITQAKSFVSSKTTACGTDFVLPVANALSLFTTDKPFDENTDRKFIFMTDGAPWPESSSLVAAATAYDMLYKYGGEFQESYNNAIDCFGFNILRADTTDTALLDNTPGDGVPVLGGTTGEVRDALVWGLDGGIYAMNPAHILRECIVDANFGMGYIGGTDTDDDSFTAAADTLYDESLGMCVLWKRDIEVEDFMKWVLRHIDAVCFVDNTTGKWKLKLIRNDYDTNNLLVLDNDNIISIENWNIPAHGELVNSVTAEYWDYETRENASLTVFDTALLQTQGNVIDVSYDYTGFPTAKLANRAALRDLRALSTPLLNCTIIANRHASGLQPGDVFKLNWTEDSLSISDSIMRVMEVYYGSGDRNVVKIVCIQDQFDYPTVSESAIDYNATKTSWEDPVETALPPAEQFGMEAPYWALVKKSGQSAVEDTLELSETSGFILAAAEAAGSEWIARMYIDEGSGYVECGQLLLCTTADLAEALTKTATTVAIESLGDIDLVDTGTVALIDAEMVYVTAISESSLSITRGCLDTVPATHIDGSKVYFWSQYFNKGSRQYFQGEDIDILISPQSGSGEMDLDAGIPIPISFDARAIRPYPPGQVKINDEYFPTNIDGEPVTSWVHRNRITQTTGDTVYNFTSANITPESGQTTEIDIYGNNGTALGRSVSIDSSRYNYPYTLYNELTDFGERQTSFQIDVASARDGYDSWQTHEISFDRDSYPPWPPMDFEWVERTSPVDQQWFDVVWIEDLGQFYAISKDGTSRLMRSDDGAHWALYGGGTINSRSCECIGYNSDDGWIIVGTDDLASSAGILYSIDNGLTFSGASSSGQYAFRQIDFWDGLSYPVVAISSQTSGVSQFHRSTNGSSWSAITIGDGTNTNQFYGIAYSPDFDVAVAVSRCQYDHTIGCAYSTNQGQSWTEVTSPASDVYWRSVAYDTYLRMFVAVGKDGATNAMYSYDGITWNLATTVPDGEWDKVIAANGVFVAVGANADAGYQSMWSPDGITWYSASTPHDYSYRGLAFSYTLRQFVSVASNGTSLDGCMSTRLLNSYWTTTSTSTTTTTTNTGSTTSSSSSTSSTTSTSTTTTTTSSTTSTTDTGTTTSSTSTTTTTNTASTTSSTTSTTNTASSTTSTTSSTTTTTVYYCMYSDTFEGDDGDPARGDIWYTFEGPDSSAEIQSDKLRISDTDVSYSYLISKWQFTGDLDIQVDLDLITYSANTGGQNELRLFETGFGSQYGVRVGLNWRAAGIYYEAYYRTTGSWVQMGSSISTSDTTARLRIKRSGSTVTCYYWNGSSWTSFGNYGWTSNDTYVNIIANSYSGFPDIVTDFYDFVVNEGCSNIVDVTTTTTTTTTTSSTTTTTTV